MKTLQESLLDDIDKHMSMFNDNVIPDLDILFGPSRSESLFDKTYADLTRFVESICHEYTTVSDYKTDGLYFCITYKDWWARDKKGPDIAVAYVKNGDLYHNLIWAHKEEETGWKIEHIPAGSVEQSSHFTPGGYSGPNKGEKILYGYSIDDESFGKKWIKWVNYIYTHQSRKKKTLFQE